MGFYSEYLERNFDPLTLTLERKKQLKQISQLRMNRDILVIASDISKPIPQIQIDYSDLLAIEDQLANLSGKSLDLILETPGGSGEVAEDIVTLLRNKYEDIAIIIPGWAEKRRYSDRYVSR